MACIDCNRPWTNRQRLVVSCGLIIIEMDPSYTLVGDGQPKAPPSLVSSVEVSTSDPWKRRYCVGGVAVPIGRRAVIQEGGNPSSQC